MQYRDEVPYACQVYSGSTLGLFDSRHMVIISIFWLYVIPCLLLVPLDFLERND